MRSDQDETSISELQQLAVQTAESFAAREETFQRFAEEQQKLHDQVRSVVGIVSQINPKNWTEEAYAEADKSLADVIRVIEEFLTKNVASAHSGRIQFFADAIRSLREAREWLAQGCSPNPELRPSLRELDDLGRESALKALDVITTRRK